MDQANQSNQPSEQPTTPGTQVEPNMPGQSENQTQVNEPMQPPDAVTQQPQQANPVNSPQPSNTSQQTSQDTNNGLAVASLVLGVLSVTGLALFTAVPGLITGVMARKRGQSSGMVTAGLILSGVSFVLIGLIIVGLLLPALLST